MHDSGLEALYEHWGWGTLTMEPDGGDIEHRPTTLFQHLFSCRLATNEYPGEIDINDFLPTLEAHFFC